MILQATSFAMYGRMVPVDDKRSKRMHPIYTAYVYNSDGQPHDFRSAYNDFELALWLDSFGFGEVRRYMETVLSCP
jgi:hypothetical protein